MPGRQRRIWAGLAALVLLAGCQGAPDARRAGPVADVMAGAPAVLRHGLDLPARIGLARMVDGRITPVPGVERARWAGSIQLVNRQLLYPLRMVPLPPPATRVAARLGDAARPRQGAGAAVDSVLDAAAQAGVDAVLVYELSVRVEDDRAAAALADLPLLGGIVPGTVSTEGHGTALAVLVDPVSGAVMGHTSARMADRVLASLGESGGDPGAMWPAAAYAMTHILAPRVEDLLIGAVSGGW